MTINNLPIIHRHALPMFTSLLNTVCAYDPVGYGVPYNHLLFTDSLEPLVDVALQILIVTLDHDTTGGAPLEEGAVGDNLFINYLSRIHRDEGESILWHFIYFSYIPDFFFFIYNFFIRFTNFYA